MCERVQLRFLGLKLRQFVPQSTAIISAKFQPQKYILRGWSGHNMGVYLTYFWLAFLGGFFWVAFFGQLNPSYYDLATPSKLVSEAETWQKRSLWTKEQIGEVSALET